MEGYEYGYCAHDHVACEKSFWMAMRFTLRKGGGMDMLFMTIRFTLRRGRCSGYGICHRVGWGISEVVKRVYYFPEVPAEVGGKPCYSIRSSSG